MTRKKILINCITFEDGNLIPLLAKVRRWQELGTEITFFGSNDFKKSLKSSKLSFSYKFEELKNTKKIAGKFQLIFEALRRNFLALSYLRKFKNKYDVVYSISAVLDMILNPFLLKIYDKKIKWVVVFDNTVPLISGGKIISGNKAVRILAWLFYQFSLLFLKSADTIFTIKEPLKEYLIGKGFENSQLMVTGNGVEIDWIKKAKYRKKYASDALFIGRINEAKGIYDMLNVIEIVKKSMPNFQLAIMGKGDFSTEDKFKKNITERGLDKNIKFLGYKSGLEKFEIIKSSKCFLFLSETESLAQAPLEAVCSGLRTLVYNLDAYDMYKNNELTIFKIHDYKSVAQKIVEIFRKNDFDNKKGKLLLNKFSWDRISGIEFGAF